MLSTSDFKRGLRILVDGEPWTIEDYTVQTLRSRRGHAGAHQAAQHPLGSLDKTFKSGRVREPDVSFRQVHSTPTATPTTSWTRPTAARASQTDLEEDGPWRRTGCSSTPSSTTAAWWA
jgi:hypothetical protein